MNTAMNQPPLGIQRIIERPGRASYVRTEELLCPCCGHLTRHEWEQDTGVGYRAIETHCVNRECAGYMQSLRLDAFFERFGSTEPNPQTPNYLGEATK